MPAQSSISGCWVFSNPFSQSPVHFAHECVSTEIRISREHKKPTLRLGMAPQPGAAPNHAIPWGIVRSSTIISGPGGLLACWWVWNAFVDHSFTPHLYATPLWNSWVFLCSAWHANISVRKHSADLSKCLPTPPICRKSEYSMRAKFVLPVMTELIIWQDAQKTRKWCQNVSKRWIFHAGKNCFDSDDRISFIARCTKTRK